MFFKKENKIKNNRWKRENVLLIDKVLNQTFPIHELYGAFNETDNSISLWFNNSLLTNLTCSKDTYITLLNHGLIKTDCYIEPIKTTPHKTKEKNEIYFIDSFLVIEDEFIDVYTLQLSVKNQSFIIHSEQRALCELALTEKEQFINDLNNVKQCFKSELTGESLKHFENTQLRNRQLETEDKEREKRLNNLQNNLDEQLELGFPSIIVTTESVSPFKVKERLGIVSAEYAHRSTIMKDAFAEISHIGKDRNKNTQNALKRAKKEALLELKKEAYLLGADAVIAVDLDYSEISGAGEPLLFLVINGTAISILQD